MLSVGRLLRGDYDVKEPPVGIGRVHRIEKAGMTAGLSSEAMQAHINGMTIQGNATRQLILDLIRQGVKTKKELAFKSGMSMPTITRQTNDLLDAEQITKTSKGRQSYFYPA